MESNKVFVGCCMLILNPSGDKVLVAQRKKEPDINGWQIPGGTVDYGASEEMASAALREAKEETGLEVSNSQFLCIMNTTYFGKDRPIHVAFVGWSSTDEIPPNPEPHKSGDWGWVPLNNLPEGKWFRMSKIAINFYNSKKDDPSLPGFVVDSI
jgi:ADP-ribose pyrophosphatase YjhB (NUDIX family)